MPWNAADYLDMKRELAAELGMPQRCRNRQCRRSRRCVGRSGRFPSRNQMICLKSLGAWFRCWRFAEALLIRSMERPPSSVNWSQAPRQEKWWFRRIFAARDRALVRIFRRRYGEQEYRTALANPDHPLAYAFQAVEMKAEFLHPRSGSSKAETPRGG